MKAPISKRVLKILSDRSSAEKLIQSVIAKNTFEDHAIKIGDKEYKLQRVTRHSKY